MINFAPVGLLILFGLSLVQEPTKVNFLLFFDHAPHRDIVKLAKEFVNTNTSNNIEVGEIHEFYIDPNMTDATKLIDHLCKQIDEIMMKTETKPHFALDLTSQGMQSEAVKIVLRILEIPTITGTSGDIMQWRNLNQQKGYLVQIAPPTDIFMQYVRYTMTEQNMTSAALLFDPTYYEMSRKHEALLQNMTHMNVYIEKLTSDKPIHWQIDKLVHAGVVNFFIAANGDLISQVLSNASLLQVMGDSLFSDKYAWYTMALTPNLETKGVYCNECNGFVRLVHLSMNEDLLNSVSRKNISPLLLRKFYPFPVENLMDVFYFDLSVDAMLTFGKLKNDGIKLQVNPPISCANSEVNEVTDELQLDVYETLQNVANENIVPFEFQVSKDGKNYIRFPMSITSWVLDPNLDKVERQVIGEWTSEGEEHVAVVQ